jgi:DNA adenine methylase
MIPKSDLIRAYRYYYLNRTSFSGKMKNPTWGYKPKRSLPPFRWKERIIPCSEKLDNVKLTSTDFESVIKTKSLGKNTLMFLDPPYFSSRQEDHYSKSFTENDHYRLANILKKSNHHFFLTYDDCLEIRKLYKWANIYDIKFYYRLDNSNDNNKKRKKGNELVITNYIVK